MVSLSAHGKPHRISQPIIGKIAPLESDWPHRIQLRERWTDDPADGFDAVLCASDMSFDAASRLFIPAVHGVSLSHLADGDVVRLDERGHVRTLYRRASKFNALFATDRCNSLCLMCSQPPRNVDDDWRVQEMLRTIKLIDRDTPELGITGGEPTLLKDGFLEVVRVCREQLPNTSVHVLSNGRLFRYGSLAKKVAAIQHHDLMIGVPVYSDLEDRHDHVVQAQGAFEDTLIGLQNLGRYGVPVEIRVVLHRYTFERLPELAEFIYRNLTFASHVAFMGMEMMGFAISNLDELWVDPFDYQEQLEQATLGLAERGMNVSVYNHQLCTVPESIWPFCRKSISDWKNDYVPQCEACEVRDDCGGFFTSAFQHRISAQIAPIVRVLPQASQQPY